MLREKVIKPLLANRGHLKKGRKPKNRGELYVHYEGVQRKMHEFFEALKLAA